MAVIVKTRVIRPSSRNERSTSYKIDTSNVSPEDVLKVIITHESKPFKATFFFNGIDVSDKNSIHFTPIERNNEICIVWKGVKPVPGNSNDNGNDDSLKTTNYSKATKSAVEKPRKVTKAVIDSSIIKKGLPCVVGESCKILILGTMPGEDSLLKQEYYGNRRNLFWKLMEVVIGSEFSSAYMDKVALLTSKEIALWDVCSACERKGSLDATISSEVPNDLHAFIELHPELKVIAFNGKRAAELYSKYFSQEDSLIYITLPSSSPLNAGIHKSKDQEKWKHLQSFLD